MTTALEGGEGSASRPGRSLPPGKTRYPLYRRLGGPQGWSGQVQNISPLPGFDPRTVQPVASRYTDYATRPIFSGVDVHEIQKHIFRLSIRVQNLRDGLAVAEWQAHMLDSTQNIPKATSHCYQRSSKGS
jgi:hypothetical protein